MSTILFLHGYGARPGGVKPSFLKSSGHEVANPALPDDDFDQAVAVAAEKFAQLRPDLVVGSSRGGAVAMALDLGETPCILIAPAWKHWGSATTVTPRTVILHSQFDETIPLAESRELAANCKLADAALIIVGANHAMNDADAQNALQQAIERLIGQ
jgi:hypothetical protein